MKSNTTARHSLWLLILVESILFAVRLFQHLYSERTNWKHWLDMEVFGILMLLLFLTTAATILLVQEPAAQLLLCAVALGTYLLFGFLWYIFRPR